MRSTGAQQPIFWCYAWPDYLDQHPDIHAAVLASDVDGVTFCLYPGQEETYPTDWLNLPNLADTNLLPWIAEVGKRFQPIAEARDAGKAVVVYEFETWCNDTGYLYPAMAAFFREMGAQVATMWEYDPEPAASYNFAASHFFNLRYTPEKAVSFTPPR